MVSTRSEEKPGFCPDEALVRITYLDGSYVERSLPLGSYEIGRVGKDISFDGDRNVSRQHARLELLPGVVRFVDLKSTCGTFTDDGARIEGVHLLRVGESVTLGNSSLALLRAPPAGSATFALSGAAATVQEMVAVKVEDWEQD